MKSNFKFLDKYWPDVAKIGENAESYLYSDPNACICKIGMMSERIVMCIYEYEKIELPEDQSASQFDSWFERTRVIA